MCKQLPVHPINCKAEEVEEMGFRYVADHFARRKDGDLLGALIEFEATHNDLVAATWTAEDPDAAQEEYDQWLWDWCYEIAYFNLICREMAPLFAAKEEAA